MPDIVCAVAVIIKSVPASGFSCDIDSVNELGKETSPPPIETALLGLDSVGYG